MCVYFKRGGEIAGSGRIGGKIWRRRGEEVGRVWGWMRQGWEWMARQGDTFFRYWGSQWVESTASSAPHLPYTATLTRIRQ